MNDYRARLAGYITIGESILMIEIYQSFTGAVMVIPTKDLPAFTEVIRRGLAFEHGQPEHFHNLYQQLVTISQPPTTVDDADRSGSI